MSGTGDRLQFVNDRRGEDNMSTITQIKKLADLRRIPVGTELVLVRNLRGPCHEPRRVDHALWLMPARRRSTP